MPQIPAMIAPTGNVTAPWIYTNGVYSPANPPTTFEILNGGLDRLNLAAPIALPTHAVQLGAFARAYYWGFDHWEFTYARQFSQDPTLGNAGESLRVVHAGLSAGFFLPWSASAVWYGYQTYARYDATIWETGNDPSTAVYEWWNLFIKYDNTPLGELLCQLPPTRSSAGTSAVTSGVDSAEPRFRQVSKIGLANSTMYPSRTSAGLHRIRVSIWPKVEPPDIDKEKILFSAGGLWVIAFK